MRDHIVSRCDLGVFLHFVKAKRRFTHYNVCIRKSAEQLLVKLIELLLVSLRSVVGSADNHDEVLRRQFRKLLYSVGSLLDNLVQRPARTAHRSDIKRPFKRCVQVICLVSSMAVSEYVNAVSERPGYSCLDASFLLFLRKGSSSQ